MTADQKLDLGRVWTWWAEHQLRGYAPLYERIATAVAGNRDLLDMVRAGPAAAQVPMVLLAAVQYLLLDEPDHPLAAVYDGRSDADPWPLFLEMCRTRRSEVEALLATRHTQTNECGRSALVGLGLTWLASAIPGPFALVDVGASAGLNLLVDRYRLDYGELGATGPADAPVRVDCRVVAGAPPIAERLPALATRVGIDRAPVDLADPDGVRWLLACVWPGTGRRERTAAAIRLAQDQRPRVVAGAANDVLPAVLAGLPDGATAVVLTTWSFAYFSPAARGRFEDILVAESFRRPVAWLSAESPGVVAALPDQAPPAHAPTDFTVLGAVIFDGGAGRRCLLGYAHQHGAWIDWRVGRTRRGGP